MKSLRYVQYAIFIVYDFFSSQYILRRPQIEQCCVLILENKYRETCSFSVFLKLLWIKR